MSMYACTYLYINNYLHGKIIIIVIHYLKTKYSKLGV